jgi:hypothetical protein
MRGQLISFHESSNSLSRYKEIANPVPIENTAEMNMIKDKYKAITLLLVKHRGKITELFKQKPGTL